MKKVKKHLFLITIIIIIIILIGILILKTNLIKKEKNIIPETDILKTEDLPKEEIITKVFVDIKGAIKKPGVYEIESDRKVIDVINLAGGLTDNANTTLINLAKQVKSEMVIIIYTNEEVKNAIEKNDNSIVKIIDKECICPNIKNDACLNNNTKKETTSSTITNNQNNNQEAPDEAPLININSATKEELESITGIGSSKAEAIISYREEFGPFTTIEDIKNVPGIGESLYEKIKAYITV